MALRSLSALCGVMTVALVYVWGRSTRGLRVGLLAATMLVLWAMHIYYSREGKGYAWVALFSCLSLFIWQRYLGGPPRRRPAPWLAASPSGALALGAHYCALLFIAGQGGGLVIWLALDHVPRAQALRRICRWLTVQIAAAAVLALWVAPTWASALRGAKRLPETQGQTVILSYVRHMGSVLSAVMGAPT